MSTHLRRTATVGLALTLAVTTLLGPATVAQEAVGQCRHILATGRRLPYVYVISLDAALNPANDRTSKAIVGRSKVATEALDGRLLGDPANLVVSSAVTSDGRYAVISAGPSSPPFSQELGHLYVIALRSRRVVATVTGVGHELYGLAVVER